MERAKVTLSGPQETMLATLCGKARDARATRPILGDRWAAQVLDQVDYDLAKTGMNPTSAAGVALRSRWFDRWTAEFLAAHPRATVLHLACGLDARSLRVAHGPSVRWVDVDLPDVVALRERLLPRPDGDYALVAASVLDEDWLAEVPADRPTVAVAEGLTMYLREPDVRRLVERITGRFPGGQLLFDVYGTIGIRLQRRVTAVRTSGSRLHWGLDDPRAPLAWHPGLRLLDDVRSVAMPGVEEFPRLGRLQMGLLARIPKLRDVGRVLRYAF
ncbi:class I SAM-dependent methyltransferase [Pseudonocardia humida]|uniref:Class I SAM-dependent methyltransferase n=1 Tax=Pseudonocardia humida TaxID=2800819 RepID=A0ABT0ZTD7_9PSEU|nr:class I SAM-dependent methyltransferase [Pseudonocardia humida]MCO1653979.1 class I SAM-dependent methyltransferase [Pseudonocardia humida]